MANDRGPTTVHEAEAIEGWWFSEGKSLPNGDRRRVAVGRTHTVDGEIEICHRGLHSSRRIIDALQYATGPIVWRVKSWGTVIEQDDKFVAAHRQYIAGGIDISDVLRAFARKCALSVIDKWDAPEIVRRYLETGDESIRAAPWYAARAAARAAAWYAARDEYNTQLTAMVWEALGLHSADAMLKAREEADDART